MQNLHTVGTGLNLWVGGISLRERGTHSPQIEGRDFQEPEDSQTRHHCQDQVKAESIPVSGNNLHETKPNKKT